MNVKVKVKSRQGRGRRVTGWLLLGLGVLVAGVWAWSGWRERTFFITNGLWGIERGEVYWVRWPPAGSGTALSRREVRAMVKEMLADAETRSALVGGDAASFVWPRWNFGTVKHLTPYPTESEWRVSFWGLPVVLCLTGGIVLRSGLAARRRALAGACVACGYDLAGLAAGAACPECGKGDGAK